MSRSEEFHRERTGFETWKDLNPDTPIYHGTNAEIKGRKIKPSMQFDNNYDGQYVAFATPDIHEARAFGKHVYEVEADEHSQEGYAGTLYSEKGFRIRRKVE